MGIWELDRNSLRSMAESGGDHEDQALHLLLLPGREVGRALHRAQARPDAHRLEVAQYVNGNPNIPTDGN